MGEAMTYYIFYFIGETGGIIGAASVACATLEDAEAEAAARLGVHLAVEVWRDGRQMAFVRHGAAQQVEDRAA